MSVKLKTKKRAEAVKKIFILVSLCLLLTACTIQSNTASIEKIEKIPTSLQEQLNPSLPLQFASEKEKVYYVIFQSPDTVTANVEKKGTTLIINLRTVPTESTVTQPHMFKLIVDRKTDVLDVFVDGQPTSMDNMILF